MKNETMIGFFLFIVTFINPSFSEDGHDHDEHSEDKQHKTQHHDKVDHSEGKAIGSGKAIQEISETSGFRLSSEAIKTLKLKLGPIQDLSFMINKESLVTSNNQKAIYRFRAGFFKLIPVKITKELKQGYEVNIEDIDFGDQVVVEGVGLLRVADVYSTDKSEYGHSH